MWIRSRTGQVPRSLKCPRQDLGSKETFLRPFQLAYVPQNGIHVLPILRPNVFVQAPLIASVVVSCLSVMRDEIESVFGDDVRSRPLSAQITVALMWAATVTSLGSTMIAVAGLAMAAGYHDSHVGITKTIIRKIRRKQERMPRALSNIHASDGCQNRAPSPANTFATTFKKERHSLAALRASEVSARVSSPIFTFSLS